MYAAYLFASCSKYSSVPRSTSKVTKGGRKIPLQRVSVRWIGLSSSLTVNQLSPPATYCRSPPLKTPGTPGQDEDATVFAAKRKREIDTASISLFQTWH